MADLLVTFELLTAKANELRALKATHDEAMSKMNTLIMGLNEIWSGDAQDAYIAKYQSMQTTFTNFSELLEGYAKLMDTTAAGFKEEDAQRASAISSFGA